MFGHAGSEPAREMGFLLLLVAACCVVAQENDAQPPKEAWDLDNFAFDTRYRTQAAFFDFANSLQAPEKKELASALKRAKNVNVMGHNGETTAANLGLEGDIGKRFSSHWNRFFWKGENVKYDKLVPEVAKRIAQGAKEGREQFYVTGRTKKLQSGTLKQLRDAGLPNADLKHLYMKKNVQVKTLPWKLETVAQIGAKSYGTESARDIDAFVEKGFKGVYSDFAMKPHGSEGPAAKGVEMINPRSTYPGRRNPRVAYPTRKRN